MKRKSDMKMGSLYVLVSALVVAFLSACSSSPSMDKGLEALSAGEYGAAVRNLRPYAEKGDLDAQIALSEAYEEIADYKNSLRWIVKAAEQGDAKAAYKAGNVYILGLGVAKDTVEAINWWKRAGEKGSIEAQWALANIYSKGDGVEESARDAAVWYLRAAESGDANAQYVIGSLFAIGHGVPLDPVKAYVWLERSTQKYNHERTRTLRDQVKASLSEEQLQDAAAQLEIK